MKLSVALFCKNLFLNLLIVLQLCAAAVFGMISTAVIAKTYTYYDLTQAIEGAYVYMPENESAYYTDSAITRHIQSKEIVVSRTRHETTVWGYDTSVADAKQAYLLKQYKIDGVYTFGSAVSVTMKKQLKKGVWFSEKAHDGIVECVIVGDNKQFPIGSVIDGAEFSMSLNEDGSGVDFSILKRYKFKVVGTCGDSAEVFIFNTSASPAESLNIQDMFCSVSYRKPNFFESINERVEKTEDNMPTVTIFCSATAFYENPISDYAIGSTGKNAIFTFADGLTKERQKTILAELKNEAGVTDIESLRENERLSARNVMTQYLPMMLCFFSLLVVGAICVAVLNMIKNKQTLKVCIICGMSTRKGVAILLAYTGILLLLSAILTLLAWTVISFVGLMPWAQMAFGTPSVIFAIASFVVSALLIMGASLPMLNKYETEGVEV